MIKKICFAFLLIMGLNSVVSAQFLPTANLTIFSEDGNKFYLILNGERQNDEPQTNIRIEELPQPYYNCKIIFEDKSMKEISKNMLMLVDANNIPQDATYKIKKDKNGKNLLRFFSFMPAEQNMIRPSNCSVYRFGNPGQMIAGPGFIQQSTTIQQQSGRGNGVGVNVNVGGVNLNVNTDMGGQGSMATTTTTTTTTTTGGRTRIQQQDDFFEQPQQQMQQQGCMNAFAMAPRDFNAALATLKNESFDEARLDIAKQIITSNCLNTNQIISMCNLFSFEASKLDFAKFAYDHCIDPNNYFKVSNLFSFSSSKQELTQYIQGR